VIRVDSGSTDPESNKGHVDCAGLGQTCISTHWLDEKRSELDVGGLRSGL
jgi:hypothetical protein